MRIRHKVGSIGTEIFEVSLVTYLALLAVEAFKNGFVSYFFNLNYLLVLVLCSGIAMVLFEPQIVKRKVQKVIWQADHLKQQIRKTRRRFDGIM